MAKLTPDKIQVENGVTIREKIIPDSARAAKTCASWCKVGQPIKPCRKLVGGVRGVTIHNTGDLAGVEDDAEQYTRATWPNCNMGGVVVHYYVDELGAWQNLREDEQGWHAADGAGPGNTTTIAIEVIMSGDGGANDKKAEDNGARLAAAILERYHLSLECLYTHNHWIGLPDRIQPGARKNCPVYILPHWQRFKDSVAGYLGQGDVPAQQYLVRVTAESLNIRKGPGTSYETTGAIQGRGVYTIVAEADGPGASKWGKLKSGAGWVSLDCCTKP